MPGLLGKVARQKSFSMISNIQARLTLAKTYLKSPKIMRKRNMLWSDVTKFFWPHLRKDKKKEQHCISPKEHYTTVKYGGGSSMLWDCFFPAGTGS